jgi:hypothetical protein
VDGVLRLVDKQTGEVLMRYQFHPFQPTNTHIKKKKIGKANGGFADMAVTRAM